jgi:hypothetical protein
LERKGIILIQLGLIKEGQSLIDKAISINRALDNVKFANAIVEEVEQETGLLSLSR